VTKADFTPEGEAVAYAHINHGVLRALLRYLKKRGIVQADFGKDLAEVEEVLSKYPDLDNFVWGAFGSLREDIGLPFEDPGKPSES
jgi:hypothetical protein